MKEILAIVPIVNYFVPCSGTESVSIKIFDRFDNEDYGLKSIDFLVPNEAL